MLHATAASVHIHRKADRLTRDALCRWICAHIDFAREGNLALAAYEARNVADVCADLGDETFSVRDVSAPDGYYLCGRTWCCCDPAREEADYCWHSISVWLLLGYRSHFARLHAEAKPAPLRKTAILVKRDPLTIRGSQDALQARLAECRLKLVGGVR